MEKLIKNLMIFIVLVLASSLYSLLVIDIFKFAGFNISSLSSTSETILKIIIDVSFMFFVFLIYRKELISEFFKYLKNFGRNFKFGFKFWLLGALLMISSNLIIAKFCPGGASNEQLVQSSLKQMPLYMIFSACIFAPFVEEIIFRKCLRKAFSNNFIFIIVSGFLFGLVHNLGSLGTLEMLYIIPYGLFGCVFAGMYVKTKTIFTSITFHFIHNTLLVAISLFSLGVL